MISDTHLVAGIDKHNGFSFGGIFRIPAQTEYPARPAPFTGRANALKIPLPTPLTAPFAPILQNWLDPPLYIARPDKQAKLAETIKSNPSPLSWNLKMLHPKNAMKASFTTARCGDIQLSW